jgi:hypothetical protein
VKFVSKVCVLLRSLRLGVFAIKTLGVVDMVRGKNLSSLTGTLAILVLNPPMNRRAILFRPDGLSRIRLRCASARQARTIWGCGDISPGLRFAGPDRFPQKWQTNGNNSQARIRLRH